MRSSSLVPIVSAMFLLTGCAAPEADLPETGTVPTGSDALYYERQGVGYPVVMLGGGSGMDLEQWDHVFPRLAESYIAIRYDPRGVGRSPTPTESFSDSDDLEQLIEYLGYKRVVVVGVSSAGGLALEFAADHGNRVAAVVAVAPFVPGFEFDEAMQRRIAGFATAAEAGQQAFLDAMFDDPHFMPAPLVPERRAVARANMARNFDDRGAPFRRPGLPPLIRRLGEIEVPVLLVAGELDHPEIVRRNEWLTGEIPGAIERRVPDAGHNVPLENPDGLLEHVLPFLERTLPVGR